MLLFAGADIEAAFPHECLELALGSVPLLDINGMSVELQDSFSDGQLSGLLMRRIAIVERGPLKGREQEWNLSRKELEELVEQGLLTGAEANECVASEFNPVRAGFHGGQDVWTRNVLNIGVRPDRIIAKVMPPCPIDVQGPHLASIKLFGSVRGVKLAGAGLGCVVQRRWSNKAVIGRSTMQACR